MYCGDGDIRGTGLRSAIAMIASIVVLAPQVWAQPAESGDDPPPQARFEVEVLPAEVEERSSEPIVRPDEEVLAEIFAGWERRRAAMQAIEVVLEGTVTLPAGIKTLQIGQMMPSEWRDRPFPLEDYTYSIELRLLFDFRTNRMRTERRDQTFQTDTVQFKLRHEFWLYDGKDVQHIRPREGNTGMGYVPSEYQTEFRYGEPRHLAFILDYSYEPVFLACGRLPRFGGGSSGFTRFTAPLQPEIFHVHGAAEHDGRECVVLRTASFDPQRETFYEFWVDVEREAAIVRARLHRQGTVRDELDIEYADGETDWMPVRVTRTSMADATQLSLREDLRVTSLVADPPLRDGDFHAEPEPGMAVRNSATGERYVYLGNGEKVDVKEHYRQKLLAEARGGGPAGWVIVAVIVAGLCGLGVWLVKRKPV